MSDIEATPAEGQLGRLIEVLALQAEASRKSTELIESRALPLLERIAVALERAPAATDRAGGPSAVAEIRRAIRARDWDQAEAVAREHPDDPRVVAASAELDAVRRSQAEDLLRKIEAARQVNDPEGAMASRDELARVLQGEPLQEVDRSLAKWLIALIQKRLRTGTIRPDVAELAAQIADRFGGTAEGASLRAALPTLRRSAGLCPRCGQPYTGVADACPKCLTSTAETALPEPEVPPEPEVDPDAEFVGEPVDLNNEDFWKSS